MYKLYARPGWGSAIVEAQLVWYGLPHGIEDVGDLLRSSEARAALAPVNPIAQIPTLIMPDGAVMTESAAITLYLAERTTAAALAPDPRDPARASFLRWLIFIVANIYPTFTYADVPARFVEHPAAGDGFRARVDAYAGQLWRLVDQTAGRPWFLGPKVSALDIYIAIMTRWRPGRAWFAADCPALTAIALAMDAEPRLQSVWRRNFPGGPAAN